MPPAAIKTKAAMQSIQGKLMASGRFKGVSLGDPIAPPNSPHAAILLSRYENKTTALDKTIETRTILVRFYIKAFDDPQGNNEILMDDMVTEFFEDLWGDFDLGGNIRNPEPLGVTAVIGYITVGEAGAKIVYRVADITLPLIVDNSSTFTQ